MMCMAGGEKPPSLYDSKEENRPPKSMKNLLTQWELRRKTDLSRSMKNPKTLIRQRENVGKTDFSRSMKNP